MYSYVSVWGCICAHEWRCYPPTTPKELEMQLCESYDMGPRGQDWVLCKSVTAEGGLSPFTSL